jgi:Dyp-type peroxidase family
MDMTLDLADTQGNILRAYAFPYARYVFLNLNDAEHARAFFGAIIPSITTSEVWPDEKPPSTLNIALTRTALLALNLPQTTINSFPDEFLEGMAARAASLGDSGNSAPEKWEAMWQGRVDIMVSIHAINIAERDRAYEDLVVIINSTGGATILSFQEANQLRIDGQLTRKEHFGYTDGISQPDFKHSHARHTPGDGKASRNGNWEDLATGDFILGYSNEACEIDAYPQPFGFSKNGTFLVYRKLSQDVKTFRAYVNEWGSLYNGGPEGLRAKFMGRWSDGTPLSLSPEKPDSTVIDDPLKVNDFTYGSDPEGLKCPLGAHIRRANPRDALGFKAKLTSRRRIIRRGMSYGHYAPESEPVDNEDRGLVFIALNANISHQFEFVQQQWINYGNDLHLGEDSDPVIGNREHGGRFVVPGDTDKGEEPFVCSNMESFVALKGGDYFFVPSLTALFLISVGLVDPR